MALENWHRTKEGNLVGLVRWAAAPGALFRLELSSDGRLTELRATADEGGTLTARQLRAAPIGAMERILRSEAEYFSVGLRSIAHNLSRLANWLEPADRAHVAGEIAEVSDLAASLADFGDRPRTGPVGRSDRSYAALSALYLEMIEKGEQRPIRAVAGRLGLAEKTVQNHLFKARERGLLTSLGRGKAGGHLTDKAKEMLSGNDQAP